MELKALSGMTLAELQQITADLELPKFTAMQMAAWIYQKQIFNIDEMTNLSKTVRERLSATFTLGRSLPAETQTSTDGTVKYLFRTISGDFVETVYIPTEDRATLCISSQVGCKMGCKFCMTGKQGFQGQLTPVDILNQIYSVPDFDKITNIVFMGQGEPLDNLDAVLRVTELLTARYGLAWSPKRITVSTVGLLSGLKKFLDQSDCNVAISLHFPFPEERIEWMPAEKAYPIEKVVALLKGYDFCKDLKRGEIRTTNHQRRLSFEYIMFKGINDTQRHAQGLVNLLRGLDCRVNLIPFHVIPNSPLRGCNADDMRIFRDYLTHHGVYTTIRASRGQDILAACGLLNTSRQEALKKGMRGQKN
ncbi:MAG: 23S rRNA (adenine(2503)-C(2))-methyltransferase RlmN [Bacteroidaceae bacterium]|nr:23S rRNA (adenine(2503)-C(2))-methyltransferase RlmN [Bacteroidaceae bacterium]